MFFNEGYKATKILLAVLAAPVLSLAQICDRPLNNSERGKVKFLPGHYVAIGSGTRVGSRLTSTLDEIKAPAMSKVIGVQKRYYWSAMHGPRANDFNFSQLIKDMDEVRKAGKKLSIMIMTKFKTDTGDNTVPQFLRSVDSYEASSYNLKSSYELNAESRFLGSYVANLGHPLVNSQFIRFLSRLATVVDDEDVVSSIVFAESALGLKPGAAPHHSMTSKHFATLRTQHIKGMLKIGTQASCIFKHTPVIQLTNFPVDMLWHLTDSYKEWSIGMGGPDVWIDDKSVLPAYFHYPRLEEHLPIGVIIAGGNFLYKSHDGELVKDLNGNGKSDELKEHLLSHVYGWSPEQTIVRLGRKALEQLHANYIFWKKNGDRGDDYYRAFKKEIVKTGAATTIAKPNSACPKNYSGNCVEKLR